LGRPVDPKTRANLLQRIIDRLAVSGLGGVTLRGVAKALDVTPPGLLHHFGSKTGMITAVIDELEREQMEVIEQVSAEGFSLEHFVRDLWAVQSSERELARIRLQLEAVTLDATETACPARSGRESWPSGSRRSPAISRRRATIARPRATMQRWYTRPSSAC
jgi:AcrR family transcriptional regulator